VTARIPPPESIPERIRTSNLCLRRATLYPIELRGRATHYALPAAEAQDGNHHGYSGFLKARPNRATPTHSTCKLLTRLRPQPNR
jgi:hypothetical protein